jgi:hypothetical protein
VVVGGGLVCDVVVQPTLTGDLRQVVFIGEANNGQGKQGRILARLDEVFDEQASDEVFHRVIILARQGLDCEKIFQLSFVSYGFPLPGAKSGGLGVSKFPIQSIGNSGIRKIYF